MRSSASVDRGNISTGNLAGMESPDLTSVYAKLNRAEEHIQILDKEIGTWLEAGSYTYLTDRNEQLTQHRFILKSYGPDPNLLWWTLIAGDAINNMRSALDHLVYAIAKYELQNVPSANVEALSFLIVDCKRKWDDRSNRKKIALLSQGVRDAIESLQPYRRTHPFLPPILAILRDLNNADKHRLLRVAAAGMTGVDVHLTTPSTGSINFAVMHEPVHDGTVIAFIDASQPEPDLILEAAQFRVEIALWHGTKDPDTPLTESRSSIIPLLRMMLQEVKFGVLEVMTAVI